MDKPLQACRGFLSILADASLDPAVCLMVGCVTMLASHVNMMMMDACMPEWETRALDLANIDASRRPLMRSLFLSLSLHLSLLSLSLPSPSSLTHTVLLDSAQYPWAVSAQYLFPKQ